MRFKTWIAAASLTLLSASAMASNFAIDAKLIPTNPQPAFSHVFVHNTPGAFADVLEFDAAGFDLSSSANPLDLILGDVAILKVSNLTYDIWGQGGTAGKFFYGSFGGNNVTNQVHLPKGSYRMTIRGEAVGAAGGVYGVSLLAAPVPEPATYAMMCAGLVLVGLCVRRRRGNAPQA